jgi:hypothetical protein
MTGRFTLMLSALALATKVSLMPAQAEEGNAAALKRQLQEVQQQLHELQLKVQRMESELNALPSPATPSTGSQPLPVQAVQPEAGAAPTPTAVTAPAPGSQPAPAPVRVEAGNSLTPAAVPEAFQWREALKAQWHGVKAGMSGDEITKLLGTPSREFTLDGKPVWYYSYPGIGNGSVMFSRDGHTVAGWQHPPFGFW